MRYATVWSTLCATLLWPAVAPSGPLEEAARRVYARYAQSVVPVRAVVRIEIPRTGAGPQERELTAWGTIVGSDGLTLVSATSLSPLIGLEEVFESSGIQPQFSILRVRIRRHDGVEIPARRLLTDDDQDVTALIPESEEDRARPWPQPVQFEPGAAAGLFDTLISLAGSAEMFGNAPIIGSAQVNGIVTHPRRLYLISRSFSHSTGTPVFLANGRPLGLTVVRRLTQAVSFARGQARVQQAVVVLPSEDVSEMIRRAREVLSKETPKGNDNP